MPRCSLLVYLANSFMATGLCQALGPNWEDEDKNMTGDKSTSRRKQRITLKGRSSTQVKAKIPEVPSFLPDTEKGPDKWLGGSGGGGGVLDLSSEHLHLSPT